MAVAVALVAWMKMLDEDKFPVQPLKMAIVGTSTEFWHWKFQKTIKVLKSSCSVPSQKTADDNNHNNHHEYI